MTVGEIAGVFLGASFIVFEDAVNALNHHWWPLLKFGSIVQFRGQKRNTENVMCVCVGDTCRVDIDTHVFEVGRSVRVHSQRKQQKIRGKKNEKKQQSRFWPIRFAH